MPAGVFSRVIVNPAGGHDRPLRLADPHALYPGPVPSFDHTIRRSERARRARIEVTAGKVEVVLPSGMPRHAAQPLLDSKRTWIERTLERLRAAEARRPAPRLEDGG